MLHIPIVHAHHKSLEKKNFHRVENVIKQLVHTSAVRSSRYEARRKFGGHERCVRVARGAAESNSSFLRNGEMEKWSSFKEALDNNPHPVIMFTKQVLAK